jgi:hypothetical protein
VAREAQERREKSLGQASIEAVTSWKLMNFGRRAERFWAASRRFAQ